MTENHYIAGDWGTSALRLFLIDSGSGALIDSTQGPGIGQIEQNTIPLLFNQLTQKWRSDYGKLPVFLCGMIGSNIGWVDAGYMDCPTELKSLSGGLVSFTSETSKVAIIPGIRCQSPTNTTDVMRGEETQILGALSLHPELAIGSHLVCLPGTHSKWVWLQDGQVINFITGVCGELYALLCQQSVLARGSMPVDAKNHGFHLGLKRNQDQIDTDLLHLLFETRSRQIAGSLSAVDSGSFMSGLMIGRDLSSGIALFADFQPRLSELVFIGNQQLVKLYARAAEIMQFKSRALDGDGLSRAGVHAIYLSSRTENKNYATEY